MAGWYGVSFKLDRPPGKHKCKHCHRDFDRHKMERRGAEVLAHCPHCNKILKQKKVTNS